MGCHTSFIKSPFDSSRNIVDRRCGVGQGCGTAATSWRIYAIHFEVARRGRASVDASLCVCVLISDARMTAVTTTEEIRGDSRCAELTAHRTCNGLDDCASGSRSAIAWFGVTFVYPIVAKLSEAYEKISGVHIGYEPIGSSGGITEIKSGVVDFGASDYPLTPEELAHDSLAQFPVVIGAIVPVINLDGVAPGQLRFTGSCSLTSIWER